MLPSNTLFIVVCGLTYILICIMDQTRNGELNIGLASQLVAHFYLRGFTNHLTQQLLFTFVLLQLAAILHMTLTTVSVRPLLFCLE